MIEALYEPEAVNWREANIGALLPGQEIAGIEHPRDWDAIGKFIAHQMLAVYYKGNSYDLDGVPDSNDDIRGYRSTVGATTLERQMEQFMVARPFEIEDLSLFYNGAVTHIPGWPYSQEVYRKRPTAVKTIPFANEASFIGAARLRSKVSGELEGAAGVHFRIDLVDQAKSADLIAASRKCFSGPTFALLSEELYPLLRRQAMSRLEYYQLSAKDYQEGVDADIISNKNHLGYLGPAALKQLLLDAAELDGNKPSPFASFS